MSDQARLDARTEEAVESFVALVETKDWVSFVELQRHAEGRGIPTKGSLSLEAVPNAVMWANMSEDFVALVHAIRTDGRVAVAGGDVLSYIADGGMLTLPVPKRVPRDPKKGYSKPYWLPTFFRPWSKVAHFP